jgi:hypothetical protein
VSDPFHRPKRFERQRQAYEDAMGTEALERQVIARERARGCTCEDTLILANRLRNAGAGHNHGCPVSLYQSGKCW